MEKEEYMVTTPEKVEEKEIIKNKGNQGQIAGAIIIAGILIAGAILIKGNSAPMVANSVDFSDVKLRAVTENEHILGNKNASIVIVEYSDTECPFCKTFNTTMHKVIEQKGDKVAWVYRHYPIPELHPKAQREAEATECAWEQGGNGAFWKYNDQLFAITPSNNQLELSELPKIASSIGLDLTAFNTCLDSGKFTAKVQADVTDGNNATINPNERGTPRSYILKKGKVVDVIQGAQPLEMVLQKLDKVL